MSERERIDRIRLTRREYRDLRGLPVMCLRCGKKCNAISWDNDPPYSICCKEGIIEHPDALTAVPGGRFP